LAPRHLTSDNVIAARCANLQAMPPTGERAGGTEERTAPHGERAYVEPTAGHSRAAA